MELLTDQATIMDYTQSVSLPSSRSSTPQVSHCFFLQLCNAMLTSESTPFTLGDAHLKSCTPHGRGKTQMQASEIDIP
ncbi:hypothetical protein TNIN_150171 [Trichonephila inaurata madagascariensis]|uniref:Uncharacterized protein n=1 Tax=Trichonephila inaurata madagascariensis TaxID=2747483 RepID=A0A8X6Y5C6_9ARAC|nr:hypothetical protein TNIN_150171 [Trichonephila inaurata madagascariensis]